MSETHPDPSANGTDREEEIARLQRAVEQYQRAMLSAHGEEFERLMRLRNEVDTRLRELQKPVAVETSDGLQLVA